MRELVHGPRTASALTSALGISQPTLSRTIREATDVVSFRVPGQRTPLYAALRSLPLGLTARQRVHRYLGGGHIRAFAELTFLAGGGTLEQADGGRTTLYDGLPPYMAFLSPSGYLGQRAARDAAEATGFFPANLRDWSDEHRIAWLFSRGLDLPGNLVFGDAALQMEMDRRSDPPIAERSRLACYVDLAQSMRGAAHGSSAGGEQPKFLATLASRGAVIVKFAKSGTRMGDLLPQEHLALRALEEAGVPAARTRLAASDGFVFLEVERFDRIDGSGRVGMLSAGSIDDEVFGRRDTWSEFAQRCVRARILGPADAIRIDTIAAFGELIGNTDRHFENLSLLIGEDGEYAGLAPAYDVLPMRYAPIGAGVDPDLTPIEPRIGSIGARPEVWETAARAADRFWRSVEANDAGVPIPPAMRRLAARNREVARAFVEPLRES